MFKSLDLIESFGSGVGKAKRAMVENIDIASVMIPISRKYLQYSYRAIDLAAKVQILDFDSQMATSKDQILDFGGPKAPLKDQNLDFGGPKAPLKDQNLDFGGQTTTSKDQNLDFGGEKIKMNGVDAIGIINRSTYSNSIRKTLINIFDRFFDEEFRRADIVSYLNASKSACTNYVSYLQKLNVVEQVKDKGKGKYRFR